MSVAIAQSLRGWNAPVFNGQPHEDARMWISNIRIGLKLRRVPQTHWVGIALRFMGEEPRAVLVDVKRRLDPDRVWDWETFTRVLVHIHDRVKKEAENADSDNIGGSAENENSDSIGDSLRRFRADHPYAAAAAGLGLITVGGLTVAPAILVGTLNLLGFGAGGVAAGSIAATIQSVFYGGAVASGSLFAMAQSASMGGIVVASGAAQAVSAGALALGAWIGLGGRGDDAPSNSSDDEPAWASRIA